MKNLILLLAAVMITAPALAQDGTSPDVDQNQTLQDDQLIPADQLDMFFSNQNADIAQRYWICVARNRFGQRFQARGWNYGRARSNALRTCQSYTPWFGRCRIVGCAQYGYDDGHGHGHGHDHDHDHGNGHGNGHDGNDLE